MLPPERPPGSPTWGPLAVLLGVGHAVTHLLRSCVVEAGEGDLLAHRALPRRPVGCVGVARPLLMDLQHAVIAVDGCLDLVSSPLHLVARSVVGLLRRRLRDVQVERGLTHLSSWQYHGAVERQSAQYVFS